MVAPAIIGFAFDDGIILTLLLEFCETLLTKHKFKQATKPFTRKRLPNITTVRRERVDEWKKINFFLEENKKLNKIDYITYKFQKDP